VQLADTCLLVREEEVLLAVGEAKTQDLASAFKKHCVLSLSGDAKDVAGLCSCVDVAVPVENRILGALEMLMLQIFGVDELMQI
jgi:hypothetical protein